MKNLKEIDEIYNNYNNYINIRNLKEFKELINRYETITLEEIQEVALLENTFNAIKISNKLTGMGNGMTCSLCIAVCNDCDICIYPNLTMYKCNSNINFDTYRQIKTAKTHKKLLTAYRNRAKYMREIFNKILQIINNPC